MVTRPIASDEPRKFNVRCDRAEFSEVMEVPVRRLSSKTYETYIAIDATEPGGQPIITPGAKIVAQHAFRDAVPWILVTVFHFPPPLTTVWCRKIAGWWRKIALAISGFTAGTSGERTNSGMNKLATSRGPLHDRFCTCSNHAEHGL